MRTTMTFSVLAAIALVSGTALAVDPPGLMNYQGVLRDDNDSPLDGSYDMVFRFYDDEDPAGPENEIFVDEHLASGTGAVTVTGGLFDVVLGSGDFYDGSGAGDHPHIYYVFGLHETVYLEVQIGAEILQPRMQVVSAPYAIHAAVLGGYTPSDFINTGSEEQEKTGLLRALGGIDFGAGANDDLTAGEVTGLTSGPGNYADFLHSHSYANNADTVDGKHASEFIDTSSDAQVKLGPLALDASTTLYSYGVQGQGQNAGGLFVDSDESGVAVVGAGHFGVQASGDVGGAYFSITGSGADATIASSESGGLGVKAYGDAEGGFFHSGGTGEAHLAAGDRGVTGIGDESGGHFQNRVDPGIEARLGYSDPLDPAHRYGIWASSSYSGGYFQNGPNAEAHLAYFDDTGLLYGVHATGTIGGRFKSAMLSAVATLGQGDTGVVGSGDTVGGVFHQTDQYEIAHLGYHSASEGDLGVKGLGRTAGGYFKNWGSASAHLAYVDELGHESGILAKGQGQGGRFEDTDGTSVASIAAGDTGVRSKGERVGGFFALLEDGPHARANIAIHETSTGREFGIVAYAPDGAGRFHRDGGSGTAYLGYLDFNGTDEYGVWAEGDYSGGYFNDANESGRAYLGTGHWGIVAEGDHLGGQFVNTASGSYGESRVATVDRGIWAAGSFSGGTFSDTIPATNVWSDLAMITGTPSTAYKITGSGQVSFVQNHPLDADKVIVYSAPEGDETAVYTRGTARLVAGEARVTLGETFKWVTNPDLGLTAHLTPHGECFGLYVESLTTNELVVRELGGGMSDVVFDFIVYGLRIGFEQSNVVQSKSREAPLAAPNMGEEFYAVRAAPEALTALDRFTQMTADARGVAPEELDLSGATALREAIRASAWQNVGSFDPAAGPPPHDRAADEPRADAPPQDSTAGAGRHAPAGFDEGAAVEDRTSPRPTSLTEFPVSGPVGIGDLLVFDPERPGSLMRCLFAQDPGVVGIAADAPLEVSGESRVGLVEANYAVLKVDAGFGEVRRGDLLTSSFTPGHAMRAPEIVPGTIVGKALEPLDSGTGSIRVLVMPR